MPTVTLEEAKENRMTLIRKKKEAMQERQTLLPFGYIRD